MCMVRDVVNQQRLKKEKEKKDREKQDRSWIQERERGREYYSEKSEREYGQLSGSCGLKEFFFLGEGVRGEREREREREKEINNKNGVK